MASYNIHAAKTQLSRLVDAAAAGEEVVIARAGRPVAKLVPFTPAAEPRAPGIWKGQIWVAEDFDAPLPPDVLGISGEPPAPLRARPRARRRRK